MDQMKSKYNSNVLVLYILNQSFILGNNKSEEGGKVCYETREGARLHFISFETRQIEKVFD